MAVLDNLIEALNTNNFFLPVSICVVVGAVLLFTVIKWLSKSDKQDTGASSFDVDDWDKENQGSSKKTKQKKVKATNAQTDNSARSKVTGKQSVAAKVAAPAAKEKQADVKAKVSTKKQAASAVPSKSIQPANEIQGEWLVAGSKKKPKSNKKTETNVQESKTKETKGHADRQTNEVEVVKTHKLSVADIASKDIGQPHETLVNSLEREVVLEARELVYDTATRVSSQAEEVVVSQPSRPSYDESPAKNQNKEPLVVEGGAGVDEGNMESDAVGKENKSKKSAKKKKSKVVVESTQVLDVVVEKTKVVQKQQDDGSQVTADIPSSSVTKPKASPSVETARKSDSKHKKVGPKDAIVSDEAKIVGPDASKDVVKVSAKSVIKVASKDVPVASKPVVPASSKVVAIDASKVVANDASKAVANDASKAVANDASKVVANETSKVVANDASKGVANDASKDVVDDASKKPVADASVDGPTSKLVAFDELGLTESSADVGQPQLKKKKKARKDI